MKKRESFCRKWKRILAVTLVAVLVLGIFPVKGVFAVTDETSQETPKPVVKVHFTLEGEEAVDSGEVQITYSKDEEERSLEGKYDEETNTTTFEPEITDPATTYTVVVNAKEGYQISTIIDEDNDSKDMMAVFQHDATKDLYEYQFVATTETKSLNLNVELQKTTGELAINATTEGSENFTGGNIKVYELDEDDTKTECTENEKVNATLTYLIKAGKKYRIEVTPDTANGYEFQSEGYQYDEEQTDKTVYYKEFTCSTDVLSVTENIAFSLKNVSLNLEMTKGGVVQIGDNSYESENKIGYKYGSTIGEVKVIPEAGYRIKSVMLGGTEQELQQDDDTVVGKISIPDINKDETVSVEFEEVETKKNSDFPENIEIVFSNKKDAASKYETKDEVIYTITKGANVILKSNNSGEKISLNDETTKIFGKYTIQACASEKQINSELTVKSICAVKNPWDQTKYELEKPVTFVFDTVSPTVIVKEKGAPVKDGYSTWISGKETGLSLEGTITDAGTDGSKYKAGVDRVVWSTEALSEEKVLAETEHVLAVTDGEFVLSLDQAPQETTTYYFYGVDKASNVSNQVTRTYKVDESEPQVTNIQTTDLVENRGVFYTKKATVNFNVKASDKGSGVKSITIYQDGVAKETKAVDENNSAAFTITLSDSAENKITASATDNVGNTTAAENYTKFENGAQIVQDDQTPEIGVNLDGFYVDTVGDVTTYYEKQDQNIKISFRQKKSGINSASVSINGVGLTEDVNGKSFAQANNDYKDSNQKKHTTDSFVISTSQVAALADGDYDITVSVTSNVDVTAVYTKNIHIHKEDQAPVIANYTVLGATKEEVNTVDSYGYYANGDVTAELTLSDGATGAGIQSVSYYFVDFTGKVSSENTVELRKRPGEEATIQIPVLADFKGYLYVKTTDNVGNIVSNAYQTTGILTEKEQTHNGNAVVTLSAEKTDRKDQNGNNLYEADTSVLVRVADAYAGIRKIEWSVNAPFDTANNRSGDVTFDNSGAASDVSWNIATKDKNLVTEVTNSIPVSNNSNDIVIWVKMTDCAGNTTEQTMTMSIDKTVPTISLSYNDVTPDQTYTSIYKDTRIATVTVKERCFDANAVAWDITSTNGASAQISGWNEQVNAENPDENTYTATVTFAADDDYTFAMNYTDLAGNAATSFETQNFTIDQTVPVIEVSMDGQPSNGNYYAQGRTATVKVTEHNFDSSRVEVSGTANDNGQTITFPVVSGWTTDGDVHTATIAFNTDGVYAFTVDGTDEGGNTAVQNVTEQFIVDQTEPTIEISGVENNSANKDVVAPVVQFLDTNYNEGTAKVELVGANHGTVEAKGTFTASDNGQTFTFADFDHEQDVDDLYTLTATEVDMAGNETQQSITFSVNRFGSVYVFDHSLKEIEGTYIKKPIDVVLTETNVDQLSMDTVKVTVSANGVPKDLQEGTDYTVAQAGGNGSWSQYTYTIDKSVFQGDGSYLVTLYSEDYAGNINENIEESKKAEIDFGVDGTAPVIVPINIEEGQSYNAQNYDTTISVVDNLVLQDVEVKLDGKNVSYTQEGDNFKFSIPESGNRQNLEVVARDAAGNEVNCKVADFLVSTNFFVRFFHNTPAVIALIGGVTAIGGGAGAFVMFRRKRIVRIKRKK